MNKQFVSALIAATMLFSCIPVTTIASDDFYEPEDIIYDGADFDDAAIEYNDYLDDPIHLYQQHLSLLFQNSTIKSRVFHDEFNVRKWQIQLPEYKDLTKPVQCFIVIKPVSRFCYFCRLE